MLQCKHEHYNSLSLSHMQKKSWDVVEVKMKLDV